MIAMPLVLRVWSPQWFVWAWMSLYVIVSFGFAVTALKRPSANLERAWSIAIAALFCLVPVSAVSYSSLPQDYWAATTVSVVFIAFEMAALPFLRIGEWRVGILLVGVTTTVCGLFVVNPLVALTLTPIVYAMTQATERLRKLKMELEDHLAAAQFTLLHDSLTGLLNRRGLTRRIEEFTDQTITIVLLDVDRFKLINDTHGHQVGDVVLVALANELQRRLPESFALARLGGDEFVAIAAGHCQVEGSVAAVVQVPVQLHGQEFTIECSFSVGVSHGDNVDVAHRLLSEAGFAMRESKRSRSGIAEFGSELAERMDRTLQVAALAGGNEGAFVPLAQTIVEGDRIVGCELLVRWQRPDGEILTPDQFLPLAIEAGLMPSINDQMLEHAVQFAARFNNRPAAPFVSVNISAPHLGEVGFCHRIESLLATYRVPPERLMIEITETEHLGGDGRWESPAAALRTLGVKLAMDDFGTGYSSLERLQHLPISHLKFDRSLVRTVSGPFGEVVRGVARFAIAANIGIIAEGIETLDELESMRAFDVATFQGFLFHRPEPLDRVEVRIIEEREGQAVGH